MVGHSAVVAVAVGTVQQAFRHENHAAGNRRGGGPDSLTAQNPGDFGRDAPPCGHLDGLEGSLAEFRQATQRWKPCLENMGKDLLGSLRSARKQQVRQGQTSNQASVSSCLFTSLSERPALSATCRAVAARRMPCWTSSLALPVWLKGSPTVASSQWENNAS